jgi:hypothetical protein
MAAQDIDIGRVGGAADDPFALGGAKGNKIHIRVQQRNGRKSITTIQVRLGKKEQKEGRTAAYIYSRPRQRGCGGQPAAALRPFLISSLHCNPPTTSPSCARLAGPGARPGPEAHLQGDEARV